jgi:hypothetical protein
MRSGALRSESFITDQGTLGAQNTENAYGEASRDKTTMNDGRKRASHKQENAPGGNRTMHSVSDIQYVHFNAGNNDRGPVSVVADRRRGADRPPRGSYAPQTQ